MRFSIYIPTRTNIKVGLSEDNELMLTNMEENKAFYTGIKSKTDLEAFKEYLDRLAIHLPKI